MSERLTKQQCEWAIKKWYKASTLERRQVEELLELMAGEDRIPLKDLNRLRCLQDNPDRVFETIALHVAEERGDTLRCFLRAVKTELHTSGEQELNKWLECASKDCVISEPDLLSVKERAALNNATTVPDLNIIKCPKCKHVMRIPKLLGCLHSYCSDCCQKDCCRKGCCLEDCCQKIVCGVCKFEHHGQLYDNIVISRRMKYLGLEMASKTCKECHITKDQEIEFCYQCKAFFCLAHKCAVDTHEKTPATDYLKSKKEELYKLSCLNHKSVMGFYCHSCNKLHCKDYETVCEGEHSMQAIDYVALEAQSIVKNFLNDGRLQALLDATHLEGACNDIRTCYKSILEEYLKRANDAAVAAFDKSKPNITNYCTYLEKYSKTLREWIGQAEIYLNFLSSQDGEWILEQWSVVSQQLYLLMLETGFECSYVTKSILTCNNRFPNSCQSAGAANYHNIRSMRLQVHSVDPSSETSASFIKELVGMARKNNADMPPQPHEIMHAIQGESNSVQYQKDEVDGVDDVTALRAQLQEQSLKMQEQSLKMQELESEIAHLRNLNISRLTSDPVPKSGVHAFSDFTVSDSQSMAIASLSTSFTLTSSNDRDGDEDMKVLRTCWADLIDSLDKAQVNNIADKMHSSEGGLSYSEYKDVVDTQNSQDSARKLLMFTRARNSAGLRIFRSALKDLDLTHLMPVTKMVTAMQTYSCNANDKDGCSDAFATTCNTKSRKRGCSRGQKHAKRRTKTECVQPTATTELSSRGHAVTPPPGPSAGSATANDKLRTDVPPGDVRAVK